MSADSTALPAILERLKAATGPDREIDAAITVALCSPIKLTDETVHLRIPRKDDDCASGTYWYVSRSGMSLRTSEPLTASLDAIRALTERIFPGHGFSSFSVGKSFHGRGRHWARVEGIGPKRKVKRSPTEPLACCIALVSALIAMEAEHAG